MKLSNLKILITTFLLLLFSYSFSQETITITLIVDTNTFNSSDPNNSCSFKAIYSKSGKVIKSDKDIENFTIDAKVDDTIIWEGTALNSKDIIDIKRIKRENNSKVFKKRRNYGKRIGNSNREIVESKILYSTKDKEDYKYVLSFKYKGRTYKIDPKIKVGKNITD